MRQREFGFTQRDFDALRRIATGFTGIVVADDKVDMFYSRLAKRVRRLGLADFSAYVSLLEEDSGTEFDEFINAITTNLTSFFREKYHFERLRDEVVPNWMEAHPQGGQLSIWSAGCSTGEEPYSIAMTLREALPKGGRWTARILATDIDSNVLAQAASGVYTGQRVEGLDRQALKRNFLRGRGAQQGKVRVRRELREMIHFRPLNLMMQPWPIKGPLDIIFCRNVLIYFDASTKAGLVDRFASLLPMGGHLFIGHSESTHHTGNGLRLLGNTLHQKQGDA